VVLGLFERRQDVCWSSVSLTSLVRAWESRQEKPASPSRPLSESRKRSVRGLGELVSRLVKSSGEHLSRSDS
jgi:hypothetical protein